MAKSFQFKNGKILIVGDKIALECCCCTVCKEDFGDEENETFTASACAGSVTGSYAIIEGELHLYSNSILNSGAGGHGQRLIVRARAENGNALSLKLGDRAVGTIVFGQTGNIGLAGGDQGLVFDDCGAGASPQTISLCLGNVDGDEARPGAVFSTGSCEVSDEFDPVYTPVTPQAWSLTSLRGTIIIEEVKVQVAQDDENHTTCPECDPDADLACLVCKDLFNRPDSGNIHIGQSCPWVGTGQILNNKLRLIDQSITGPPCDYVSLLVEGAHGSNLTIAIGALAVNIAITNSNCTISIVGGSGDQTPPVTYTSMNAGSAGHTFVMCIGQVDVQWGVSLHDGQDPYRQVSNWIGQAEPPSPYGSLTLTAVGRIDINEIHIRRRKTDDNPKCYSCKPQLCIICRDNNPVNFPLSNCKLQNLGGFDAPGINTDNIITQAPAKAVTGAKNPIGAPYLYAAAIISPNSVAGDDNVFLGVGARASGSGGAEGYITFGDTETAPCMELRIEGQVKTRQPWTNTGIIFMGMFAESEEVLFSGGSANYLTWKNPSMGGGHTVVGSTHLIEGGEIVLNDLQVYWIGYTAFHEHCGYQVGDCSIFNVAFSGASIAISAGDPAGLVACNVTFDGDWAIYTDAFNVSSWVSNAAGDSVTILTNHPEQQQSGTFSAEFFWFLQAGGGIDMPDSWNPDGGEVDREEYLEYLEAHNAKYKGMSVICDYGGGTIVVEVLGWTASHFFITFYNVTVNGQSFIQATLGAGGTLGGVYACFGRERSLIVVGNVGMGFVSQIFPATGGQDVGLEVGNGPWGTGFYDASFLLQGIRMNHTKPTTPMVGVVPEFARPVCKDCDDDICYWVGEEICLANGLPESLTLSMSPKPGADLSGVCAEDLAVLNGSHTLTKTHDGCYYQAYLGPTTPGEVDPYITRIAEFEFDPARPLCGNYISVTAHITSAGDRIWLYVSFQHMTGGVFLGFGSMMLAWRAELPGTSRFDTDCANFSVDMENASDGDSWYAFGYAELFNVHIETG